MIKQLLNNWKTTAAGLSAIIGSVVHIIFAVKHGTADESTWTASLIGIISGVGLLSAGDASQSAKQSQAVADATVVAVKTGDTSILEKTLDTTNTKPL